MKKKKQLYLILFSYYEVYIGCFNNISMRSE